MDNKKDNNDKEPEELASIAISREEIASRNRNVPGSGRSYRSTAPAPANSKALWAVSIFAVLLSTALMVQLQQVKSQTDKQLKALTILQEKLTSTDEQANLSVDAMKILLKEQDHEIRKLWDVANKRNKGKINKNSQRLDQQSKLVTQHDGKLAQLSKADSKNQKALKAEINKQKKQLADVQTELELKNSALKKQVDKAIASLPANVSKTLKEHSQGIKAMDGTRLQLMKRINALEKQVKALKQSGQPGQSSSAP